MLVYLAALFFRGQSIFNEGRSEEGSTVNRATNNVLLENVTPAAHPYMLLLLLLSGYP